MRSVRDSKVWEESRSLTLAIYKAAARLPRDGLYGLTGRLRRSRASIPANIGEDRRGHGSVGLARCFQISLDSARKLERHLLLAPDLGLLDGPEHERLAGEVTESKRMLASFVRGLKVFANQQNPKADA